VVVCLVGTKVIDEYVRSLYGANISIFLFVVGTGFFTGGGRIEERERILREY